VSGTDAEAMSGSFAVPGFEDGLSTTDFFVAVCIVMILPTDQYATVLTAAKACCASTHFK